MAPGNHVLRILWARFSWRHWRMSPVSSGLLLLILAIGVAAFFSIRLANQAAVASFQNFTDLITSQSDGLITAPSGTLPDSILPELRRIIGNEPVNIVPVLEASAVSPGTDEKESLGERPVFQVLGLDLASLPNLASSGGGSQGWFYSGSAADANDFTNSFSSILQDPLAVFASHALAVRAHLTNGSRLPLIINEHPVELRVAGIIPQSPGQPEAPANFLIMDLPALQKLSDKPGELDRVEFVVEPGPHRGEVWLRTREKLEQADLGGAHRWLVSSPNNRREAATTMTRAFRLNLTILSLLALLVGLYLVFQGLDGAVTRRRNEIAVLRSLGVTSRQMQIAWLVEAGAVGLAGGILGLGLGWLGAQFAVKLVARTVNTLYYANSADSAAFDFGEALAALAVSVLASLVAGWGPARAAANTPPAQVASRAAASIYQGNKWLRSGALAFALLVCGYLLTWLPPWRLSGGGRLPVASYASAICWLFGAGIFAGISLGWIARLVQWLKIESVPLRLAVGQLRKPSGRHRLAVAGLVCATGMTAGMAILVGSFDTTMRGWIARTFQADIYISSDGAQSASSTSRISPQTWRGVVADPAVGEANVVQVMEINIGGVSTLLAGNHLSFFRDRANPAWVEAPASDAVFDPARNSGLALASESFSDRFRVHRGGKVGVPAPGGVRWVTIEGIFADYGNERGSLLVERSQFTNWFGNELAASLILSLKPGQDAEAVRARLRREHPGLGVFTSAFLRVEALRIFRQTFAVTYALELIGIAVAVAGLAFTMTSLLWERRADLATMRAIGLRRRELALGAALEGALTAAAGLVSGLAVSLALGWLLIYRINKQTFGWTLQTDYPWVQLLLLSLLVVSSSAAAGWFAGQWAARLPGEREE